MLSNILALAAGQGVMGLAFIVIARRLGPEVFGSFAAAYALTLVVGGLLDFGSGQRMTRDLSQGLLRSEFTAWLIKRTAFQLPVALAFSIGLALFFDSLPGLLVPLCLGSQALTYPLSTGAGVAVRALRSPALAAWFAAFGNLTVLGAAVWVSDDRLLGAVAVASTGSWLLTAGLSLATTRRLITHRPLSTKRNPWKGCVPFGVSGLAYASPGLYIGLIAVGAGPAQAGLAAAVQKWIQPITLIPNGFSTQMFPAFAAAPTDQDALQALRSLRRVAWVAFASVAVLVVFAPQLTQGLLGVAYADTTLILRMYALSILPVILSQPLSTFLQARGHEQIVARTSMSLALVSLPAVYVLSLFVGARAAPIVMSAYSLILLTAFVLQLRTLRR